MAGDDWQWEAIEAGLRSIAKKVTRDRPTERRAPRGIAMDEKPNELEYTLATRGLEELLAAFKGDLDKGQLRRLAEHMLMWLGVELEEPGRGPGRPPSARTAFLEYYYRLDRDVRQNKSDHALAAGCRAKGCQASVSRLSAIAKMVKWEDKNG
jgi:hypothetical protein